MSPQLSGQQPRNDWGKTPAESSVRGEHPQPNDAGHRQPTGARAPADPSPSAPARPPRRRRTAARGPAAAAAGAVSRDR